MKRALSIKARRFYFLILARHRCLALCSAFLILYHLITAEKRSLSTQLGRYIGDISFTDRVAVIFESNSYLALRYSPQAKIAHQYRRRFAD